MKVALITGAARGIGAATAKAFTEAGYTVAILDKDGDELRTTANQLQESGAEVLALETDLTSLEQIEEAVNQTAERFGRIDALINNAATRELETIREITHFYELSNQVEPIHRGIHKETLALEIHLLDSTNALQADNRILAGNNCQFRSKSGKNWH